MNSSSLAQRTFLQPHFCHTGFKGPSLTGGNCQPSLNDSQESDRECLTQEIEYQRELQKWISDNEELLGLSSDELENDSLEEDSLEDTSVNNPESANHGKVLSSGKEYGKQKSNNNKSKQQSVDRYCHLRYNPNWKMIKEGGELSEVQRTSQTTEKTPQCSSGDFSYLPSKGILDRTLEENNQLVEEPQNISPEFNAELLSPDDQIVSVSREPFRLHTEGKKPEDCQQKTSSGTYSDVSSLQSGQVKQQKAKKDFVEKNKLTLGQAANMHNSYLQLHSKKQGEVLHEQDHQDKRNQADKTKPKQRFKERFFPRNDVQHPSGRPAEPRSQCHSHGDMSEFATAPTGALSSEVLELEQDELSSLHNWLHASPFLSPISPSIKSSSIANWDTHSNTKPSTNFQNQNRKQISMNLNSPKQPLELALHKRSPGLKPSPVHVRDENKAYQHDPGNPYNREHIYNDSILEPLPSNGYTSGQTHLQSISSAYNANLQEPDHVSQQSYRKQMHADKSHHKYASSSFWPSQSSAHNPLASSSPTTQLIQTMERHQQEISQLADAHLAGKRLPGMFPAIIPRVESDSELNAERSEGSQVKMSRSNSEGYLVQLEKQKHLKEKAGRQLSKPKGFMNLDVKLGGLGPDYVTAKEKKEKLKQQKEYAQLVKERNMKNIVTVQKPPTPKIKSLASRHKALEYAKKIPKPKPLSARQADEELKEERIPAQTLRGHSLPQISSLETLQYRHEKEKEVVAAFKTLHIL
ncbi:jhy protein homolog [Alligator mississippiensis]|uniref:jhy protein homolog n=1 Tax=Alligator mississippiensis TaxID=8496 RepID=UPI0003D0E7D1|nr:jhy protein homolog [Alligator mississippiensis]